MIEEPNAQQGLSHPQIWKDTIDEFKSSSNEDINKNSNSEVS